MGGNLGFDVRFALDATHTFDRTGPDGTVMTADELARATATNLHGEFATVVRRRRCWRAPDEVPVLGVRLTVSWSGAQAAGSLPPALRSHQAISGMIRSATMLATLIIGLMAGPAVSLNGSPTVSPVIDAAWASEPLPP